MPGRYESFVIHHDNLPLHTGCCCDARRCCSRFIRRTTGSCIMQSIHFVLEAFGQHVASFRPVLCPSIVRRDEEHSGEMVDEECWRDAMTAEATDELVGPLPQAQAAGWMLQHSVAFVCSPGVRLWMVCFTAALPSVTLWRRGKLEDVGFFSFV